MYLYLPCCPAGPEGWLSRTGLLPCHYFVHSFGSPASYQLRRWGETSPPLARALVHMERNYGEAFPTGYTWAQATAPNGSAFLVATGGLFVIGPVTSLTYIIGFRAPGRYDACSAGGIVTSSNFAWDFRTTDLDRIRARRSPCAGELALNATSRDGRRRLLLFFSAPPNSFGEAMPIPTQNGFSSIPGCRESYAASVSIKAEVRSHGRRWEQVLDISTSLVALEFGGSWQC